MKRTTLSLAIASALITAPAAVVADENPYMAPDDSWVSLSGTVTSTTGDSFKLDYGDGLITVEMDDWDWFNENRQILQGDEVTVYGEVDDDTWETATIEASSVFVDSLGTYFYANPVDEEAYTDIDMAPTIVLGDLTVTGTVTSVSGSEFTIDSGAQEMTVDTAMMGYNPMDEEGFQKIEKGDVVSVTGNIDDDTFEARELMAETIVTLENDDSSS